MICINLLLGTVIKHLQRLYADGKAAGQTLFVHIVVGVPAGMIVVLQLVVQTAESVAPPSGGTQPFLQGTLMAAAASINRSDTSLSAFTVPFRSR